MIILKTILVTIIYFVSLFILAKFLYKQYRKRKIEYEQKYQKEENVFDITIQTNFFVYFGFSFISITSLYLIYLNEDFIKNLINIKETIVIFFV